VDCALPKVAAIFFDADRSDEDTSSALTFLRVPGKGWPDSIFHCLLSSLSTRSRDDCSYPGCLLRCLDVLGSADEAHTSLDDFVYENLDYVMQLVIRDDQELSKHAFALLSHMLYRLRHILSCDDLNGILAYLGELAPTDTQLANLFRCFTALLHSPLAKDPGSGLPLNFRMHLLEPIDLAISELDDVELVEAAFKLVDMLVSVLHEDASELVIEYCVCVVTKLFAAPSPELTPHMFLTLRQYRLATAGVLLRHHPTTLADRGFEVITLLLRAAIDELVPIITDLLSALVNMVSGFRGEVCLPESAPTSLSTTGVWLMRC
jgi:hypothetical protein